MSSGDDSVIKWFKSKRDNRIDFGLFLYTPNKNTTKRYIFWFDRVDFPFFFVNECPCLLLYYYVVCTYFVIADDQYTWDIRISNLTDKIYCVYISVEFHHLCFASHPFRLKLIWFVYGHFEEFDIVFNVTFISCEIWLLFVTFLYTLSAVRFHRKTLKCSTIAFVIAIEYRIFVCWNLLAFTFVCVLCDAFLSIYPYYEHIFVVHLKIWSGGKYEKGQFTSVTQVIGSYINAIETKRVCVCGKQRKEEQIWERIFNLNWKQIKEMTEKKSNE